MSEILGFSLTRRHEFIELAPRVIMGANLFRLGDPDDPFMDSFGVWYFYVEARGPKCMHGFEPRTIDNAAMAEKIARTMRTCEDALRHENPQSFGEYAAPIMAALGGIKMEIYEGKWRAVIPITEAGPHIDRFVSKTIACREHYISHTPGFDHLLFKTGVEMHDGRRVKAWLNENIGGGWEAVLDHGGWALCLAFECEADAALARMKFPDFES